MPRRSIATFDRVRIVTLCQVGLSSREVSRRLRENQSDVVRTWGGTEIQELSVTCVAQATQRPLLQLMTATNGFQHGGTLKATPPCWLMLFVQPKDVVIRLKLYEIGCMMRNFTPDVHGEVHIWHLDTLQRGTDGPKNTLNVHIRIGIKFYSEISVTCTFYQTIVRDVFGGSLVRLNVSDTLSSKCSKVVVPWCFGVALWDRRTPLVVMEGAETAIRYRNDILRPYTEPISAEFREELVLMDDNSHSHRAHLVNEFLHDNNIARLEWPACSPDMNPIEHAWDTLKRAVFGRDDPPATQSSTPNRRWAMGQSEPTGPCYTRGQYATTNIGMHQCKRTCYWVFRCTGYAATTNTNSESLAVLLYNLQFLVFMSNTESWNVVFVYLYSISMQRFRNS